MEKVDRHPQQHLYPPLDEGQPVSGADYRIAEVARIRDQLKAEAATREALHKKYSRAVNAVESLDVGVTAASIALGGVGTGLLVTVVAAPAVPIILGVGAACGLVSAGSKVAASRLRLKARTHDRIRVLAEGKLNSISSLVSKALEDGVISHAEFQTVVNEAMSYATLKEEIRSGAQKKRLELDEATKKELVERGRREAHHSFMRKLGAGSSP